MQIVLFHFGLACVNGKQTFVFKYVPKKSVCILETKNIIS